MHSVSFKVVLILRLNIETTLLEKIECYITHKILELSLEKLQKVLVIMNLALKNQTCVQHTYSKLY